MKTLRFLLVMTFMLTLFVSPVQAQGGGSEMGFVSLLTQVDPAIPFRVQAQDAYERILPVLLAAQKSGTVLEFQPEFSVGVVKIKYAASARPAMLGGMKVYDDIHAAAIVPHSFPDKGQVRTTFNPNFAIYLYESCVDVYGLGSGNRVVASLRNQAGQILGVFENYADSSGYTWDCFSGSYGNVLPGYKVTFKVYNSLGGLRGTYSSSAPAISYTAMDPMNSIVSGTGPAGKAYNAWWFHCNLNAANTCYWTNQTGTISSAKTWSVDFGTTKFRGSDTIWIYVNYGSRFSYDLWTRVHYSYCYLGADYCALMGFAKQAASMTITHAGTPYTFTGQSDFHGWFGSSLEDTSGLPIFLVAGDTFVGTGISLYSLPNLTAAVDFSTDVVSGKAPANKYFWVGIYYPYSGTWYDLWVHSNAYGNYSANFHSLVDLKSTDAFIVEISYQDPVKGNRTYLEQPFGP
jgi:hypothetical protein